MEALRIHLTQTSANYRREETIDNKMTYPLPPFSTVIGALHNLCGFSEYHPMDISIQGDYKSMTKEAYTDYCFLNSTEPDRGILVKMANTTLLSKGYTVVAEAVKRNASFQKNKYISIKSKELMEKYWALKDLNDEIDNFKKGRYKRCMDRIKNRKKALAEKKKNTDKDSVLYKKIIEREKEIKNTEKTIKKRFEEYKLEKYTKPISMFRTLTTSLKYYEVLSDIELYIHVKSDSETLNKIKENIYEWKSLGRSEDFVEIKEVELVSLIEPDKTYESSFHGYIDATVADDTDNSNVMLSTDGPKTMLRGLKYFLNKNYEIDEKGRRIFEKKKVYYTSTYEVDEESKYVYIDNSKEVPLIVNFV
ncbi:CRISPR-associated protein Cas5 [Peptostreptococcaceae bacterium OttesenSCG-928-C18]|nr:CRISPR-associated protein Cas5 [Peptostreptococcaceae bacterium OttesenSCG-928-C18]